MEPFVEALPAAVEDKLKGLKPPEEEVRIQVAADMADEHRFGEQWLVVTEKRLFFISPTGADGVVEVLLEQVGEVQIQDLVGGARLEVERKDGPSALIFSRQNLPFHVRDNETEAAIARGGYILKNCAGEPELILIATGSEVSLAVQAADKLTEQGRKVRVVSMPCTSVFDAQDAAYKQQVLPVEVGARIAIEAAHADYWYKYVGLDGRIIGMTTYGESAPAGQLFEEFGFTVDNILSVAEELLED